MRDIDSSTARPPLPPRALPDSVRAALKLAPREPLAPRVRQPASAPSAAGKKPQWN